MLAFTSTGLQPTAPISIDWVKEGALAVARTIADEVDQDVIVEAPGEQPGGIFGGSDRTGTVETFDDGTERHWVSRNCYRDIPKMVVSPNPMQIGGLQLYPVFCKGRGSNPNLFDHLKPQYLRNQ